MTKTGYNVRNSNYLGNKELSSSNKLTVQCKKIPKMSGALRDNICETCHNVPQKTLMNGFTRKNSLARQIIFRNVCSNFL